MEILSDILLQRLMFWGLLFYVFAKLKVIPPVGNMACFRDRSADLSLIMILPVIYAVCFSASVGRVFDLLCARHYFFTFVFALAGLIIGLLIAFKNAE